MTLSDYLLDHYGHCLLEPVSGCRCLRDSFQGFIWEGRKRLHWQPFRAESWQELAEIQREIKNAISK